MCPIRRGRGGGSLFYRFAVFTRSMQLKFRNTFNTVKHRPIMINGLILRAHRIFKIYCIANTIMFRILHLMKYLYEECNHFFCLKRWWVQGKPFHIACQGHLRLPQLHIRSRIIRKHLLGCHSLCSLAEWARAHLVEDEKLLI